MNKFITNGDVSYLGHSIKDLNSRIEIAESMEKVEECDMILSVNRSNPCETAEKLKITRNKFKGDA